MAWLTPSIIATAIGTALLSFVYYYLYFIDRKKYLAIWAVSWSVYFIRFTFDLGMIMAPKNDILLIGNQIATLFSGIILLWGTYQFIDKKFSKIWLFCSGIGVVWIIISISLKFGFLLMSIPTFTFLATVYIWTGLTFIKSKVNQGSAKTITGVAFIIWGIHKANYPFLRPIVWFAPWGYLLGAMLEFTIALGMLLVYYQKVRDDLKAEEYFLQKAQEIGKVGTWELDVKKNQLVWTEENYKIFGVPSGTELTYETFLGCVHPDDRKYVDNNWKAALNKKPYDIVHRLIVNGKVKWVREKAELEFDENGNCISGIGFTQDITELKWSQERYRSILQTTIDGFWVTDIKGKLLEVNNSYCRMSGYSEDELLTMNVADIEAIETPEIIDRRMENIIEKGSDRFESKHRRKDGAIFDIEVSIQFRTEEGGQCVCFLQDITERKRAEAALKESKLFLDNMSDIAYRADDKGNLIWVNSSAERIIGLSPEEIIGKPFLPLFIEADHASLMDVYKRSLMGESLENTLTFTSGVICHFTSLPNRNDKGDIIGTFGVARDITERLNAEKALQLSEYRLKKAQAVAKIGNWEYDISTGRVWGSEEAFRIYGIERTSEYLPLDDVENNIIEAKRVNQALVDLITKGVNYDMEFQIIQKDTQRLITVHSIAEIVRDNEGNPLKVLGVIQNITDSKAKEKENLELIAQLQQAQKMESIGTLAGGIAHDFNNILFPIVGHTEMLMEDVPDDSPFRDSLNEIYTGSLRARDLVQQILSFSRQGKSELKLMKMQPIIKEALKLIRSTIPTTISINQNLQPECGAVEADPTQIHQIIMNLATNAYHAMEKTGGELNVTLKKIQLDGHELITPDMKPGSYACLTIKDTGTGMSKNVMDKIFDPFFTTKEKGKGTGMGLSVVHGIVKSMNGEIKVYSEPGKGTEFHIYLPIIKSNFETQEIQTKEPLPIGTERILLVDDEESIIAMERQALERLGYHVASHADSVEALETFRINPEKFDIVISDMAMPKMPGDKLAVELIKIRPDIPVLLCTGFSEAMTEEKTTSLGIKGLLLKPIIIKDLAKKMREVLDKK